MFPTCHWSIQNTSSNGDGAGPSLLTYILGGGGSSRGERRNDQIQIQGTRGILREKGRKIKPHHSTESSFFTAISATTSQSVFLGLSAVLIVGEILTLLCLFSMLIKCSSPLVYATKVGAHNNAVFLYACPEFLYFNLHSDHFQIQMSSPSFWLEFFLRMPDFLV